MEKIKLKDDNILIAILIEQCEKKISAKDHTCICGPGSFSTIRRLVLGDIADIPANKVNSELHEGLQSWEVAHMLWPFLFSV